ncbi:MAG: hypothetical protein R3B91_04945 [Planctomycetaceae bacterium]
MPVTYRLVGHEIAYAVICTDPAAGIWTSSPSTSQIWGMWTIAGVKGPTCGPLVGSSARAKS